MIAMPFRLAPAKINLYLHVTGKRPDGYHDLDSLVVFADIGDRISLEKSDNLTLEIDGPFAGTFSAKEKDTGRESGNIIIRALWALADASGERPDFHLRLTKNLPLAAGLGGGSADAAALVKLWMEQTQIPIDTKILQGILQKLGADVPVCYDQKPARLLRTGHFFERMSLPKNIPAVLINPLKPCSTSAVFSNCAPPYTSPLDHIPENMDQTRLFDFLVHTGNDLIKPAIARVPEIPGMLETLLAQQGCALSRLSGSGATCFGVFETFTQAEIAATTLQQTHPNWWIASAQLNP